MPDISKHPILRQISELVQAIELCGASPALTNAVSMACALFVDIVFLHGRKPLWAWYLLNVPFLWYIYEKTLRKFVLTFVRNMAAIFVVMFPE